MLQYLRKILVIGLIGLQGVSGFLLAVFMSGNIWFMFAFNYEGQHNPPFSALEFSFFGLSGGVSIMLLLVFRLINWINVSWHGVSAGIFWLSWAAIIALTEELAIYENITQDERTIVVVIFSALAFASFMQLAFLDNKSIASERRPIQARTFGVPVVITFVMVLPLGALNILQKIGKVERLGIVKVWVPRGTQKHDVLRAFDGDRKTYWSIASKAGVVFRIPLEMPCGRFTEGINISLVPDTTRRASRIRVSAKFEKGPHRVSEVDSLTESVSFVFEPYPYEFLELSFESENAGVFQISEILITKRLPRWRWYPGVDLYICNQFDPEHDMPKVIYQ